MCLKAVSLYLRVVCLFVCLDFFIYFNRRESKRDQEQTGGWAEGGGKGDSQADSLLRAEPYVGLELMTLRS